VDGEIQEEDKAMILLNFLPDEEYETFILILINSKQTLKYSDVSAALINYEVRKKNKQSSSKSDSAKELTKRGWSLVRRAKSIVEDRNLDQVLENIRRTSVSSVKS